MIVMYQKYLPQTLQYVRGEESGVFSHFVLWSGSWAVVGEELSSRGTSERQSLQSVPRG